MVGILSKFFDSNEREIKRLRSIVNKINELEPEMQKLKEKDFEKKTVEFKERLAQGEDLDNLLPEAFALVREAAFRTIGERHYDVQLMAAITLHEGKIAEMKTGEGKTLSASPAMYLNALTGRGVHLVTVNDYLARRDAGWMAHVFHTLGITVSAIISERSFLYDPSYIDESAVDWRLRHLKPISRKEAYEADITYGINSEYGFDYLRDNMVSDISQVVQKDYHFAIVDEVDSVLIDEARTPHIISAPAMEATHKYYDYAKMVDKLTPDVDYQIDEKLRTAHLTDHGIIKLEKMMGVGNVYESDFEAVHHIEAALKARVLFHKDKQYVVKDGQVIIVDEFTGRLLNGRRFSEGIHQAIEAKEEVSIQQESKTLATVSLQNYFRMYQKLSGMTGTALTEAEEFHKIYELDVTAIPTHRPMKRIDETDSVYKTTRAKYAAIVNDIIEAHKKGQPVLVGTTSIDKNEIISELLKRKNVPHQVLNAKNHLQEAMIIAEAGKKGAVTVATNMAGRGVDIILGGSKKERWEVESEKEWKKEREEWQKLHDEVIEAGGLRVIGSERHESRRIDNQLRGRAGRQGDPGSSKFFVSLEDDIMRIFGGDQVSRLMSAFKLPEDVPLEHAMVGRAIHQAQVKVEGFHFDSRKHLVEYDDVLNKQREIVYKRRKLVLEGQNQKDEILQKITDELSLLSQIETKDDGKVDEARVAQEVSTIVPFDAQSITHLTDHLKTLPSTQEVITYLTMMSKELYESREKQVTPDVMRQIERWVSLQAIDTFWMEHLDAIDDLREGIGLRGYGQREPLVEYKHEAFNMFEQLIAGIDKEIVHRIYRVEIQVRPNQAPPPVNLPEETGNKKQSKKQVPTPVPVPAIPTETALTQSAKKAGAADRDKVKEPVKHVNKLGRNDPCWCGSGKKWKKCHYPQTS
jgi:preprotein translocase subunit SecA